MLRSAVLAVLAVLTLAGCSADDPTVRDTHVLPGLRGNGQNRLLAQSTFHTALEGLGISPELRPAKVLGTALGHRMRDVVTDAGRVDIASFTGRYRTELTKLGPLTEAQFAQRYGSDPQTMADRVGVVVGQLAAGLNERADPPPPLAHRVLAAFGTDDGAKPHAHAAIDAVQARLSALFPESNELTCLASYRSAYSFTVRMLTTD